MKQIVLALAATLAMTSLASAQTYRDSGGNQVLGVVPLGGCSASGPCSGPASGTNPLPVSGSVTITNANANGQATSANSAPVVIASDQSAVTVKYAAGDPCQANAKSYVAINLTASGQIIAGTSSKKTYICSIDLVTATAQNIALVEGTGSVCATNVYGIAGGATAATGWNFSANAGLVKGNGNAVAYGPPTADANATAANVCLLLSGTGQTSGQVAYVQQ